LLRTRFEQADALSEEDFAKLLGETRKFVGVGRPDKIAANLAMTAATTAEGANRPKIAIEAYQYYGKLLADSGDPKLAGLAATLQGAARRLGLLGKEMTVAGRTPAGKPLDWGKYKGKVVLVDFWATWCGPCRGEIPNIAQNYETYHDRGFEVVSISVDSDREALEGFLKENAHPWTVLMDAAAERGTDQSLSTYYGILSIPQMILIGRDGKVVALGVRGAELGRELEKLLGPAEGPKKKGPAEG
jgi:thiol-disulfide isomerase/thioredoxin